MSLFYLYILFIILQPTILLHEIGHAIGIILFTKDCEANIFLGKASFENKIKFSIGRMHFYLSLGIVGFCFMTDREASKNLSRKQLMIIDASGPLMSLFIFLIAVIASLLLGEFHFPLKELALLNIVIFITSACPYTYPSWEGALAGMPSDGLRILRLARKQDAWKGKV